MSNIIPIEDFLAYLRETYNPANLNAWVRKVCHFDTKAFTGSKALAPCYGFYFVGRNGEKITKFNVSNMTITKSPFPTKAEKDNYFRITGKEIANEGWLRDDDEPRATTGSALFEHMPSDEELENITEFSIETINFLRRNHVITPFGELSVYIGIIASEILNSVPEFKRNKRLRPGGINIIKEKTKDGTKYINPSANIKLILNVRGKPPTSNPTSLKRFISDGDVDRYEPVTYEDMPADNVNISYILKWGTKVDAVLEYAYFTIAQNTLFINAKCKALIIIGENSGDSSNEDCSNFLREQRARINIENGSTQENTTTTTNAPIPLPVSELPGNEDAF